MPRKLFPELEIHPVWERAFIYASIDLQIKKENEERKEAERKAKRRK